MSKHYFLLWFMFLTASAGFAQTKSKAVKLYDAGNTAFAKNDYRTADSLFSLSLELEPHPDAYYNRAVCRRKMNNFKGYCQDLEGAAELNDQEAGKLYWKQCVKVDTIFKGEEGERVDESKSDIIEFVKSYKYNTDFDYEKFSKKGILLLSKVRVDNVVSYRKSIEVEAATYKGSTDSLSDYIQRKYQDLAISKINAGNLYMTLMVDENGNLKDISKAGKNSEDEISVSLKKTILSMPAWQPASYQGRAVHFRLNLNVTYYDDEIVASDISSSEYNVGKVTDSSEDEEMPEFPGGPVEMMRFISKNIVYPQMAKEAGLSGKCFLRFVVDSTGIIKNVQLLRGIPGCMECNREAIRVIKKMPKWKPGMQKGKPVPVFFNLPINFKLL
jgi:TonB family protein